MLPVPAIALMLTNFFLHGPAPEFYSNPNPVIEVAQLCDDNTGVCQYVDKQFVVAKEETRKQLQHEEAARLKAAQEKAEQERIALQKAEQERVAAERAEQERVAREKSEQERVAKEQAEQERIALENAEQQRLANEKAEQERVAAEKAEQERVAAEKTEQERLAAEKAAEEQRISAEKAAAEEKRVAAEKAAEEQRVAAEKAAEEQRIAAEKAAEEKKAQEAAAAKPKEAEKKEPAAKKEAAPAKEAATPEPKSKEPEEYGGEFKWTQEQKNALDKHNELRTKHGAAFLNLSKGLSVMATKWAKHLASIDKMEHTTLEQRQNTGESLYVEFGRDVNSGEGERATQWWYDEIKDYDYSKPVFDWATGHFTQLVWFGTIDMGLGVAVSETGKTYVVANYFPPGNTAGQFEANVGKALNKK